MKEVNRETLIAKIKSLQSRGNAEYSIGLTLNEEFQLAAFKMLLTTMDSEPVVYMWDSKRNDIDVPGFYFPEHLFFAESNVKQWGGEIIPLYRRAAMLNRK